MLALEILGVTYACVAGAFGARLELLHGISDLPRLLLPVSVAMGVLLARSGRRVSNEHSASTSVADVLLASAGVLAVELLLSVLKADWVMQRWAPTQGGFVGFCFLTAVRTAFPAGPKPERMMPAVSAEELALRHDHLTESGKKIAGVILFAAAVLFGFGVLGLMKAASAPRLAGAVLLLLFSMWSTAGTLRTAIAPPPGGPDWQSYRKALQSRRTLLRQTLFGVLTFLMPGLLCALHGSEVYAFVVVVYVLGITEAMRRAITTVDAELRLVSVRST
ncbi:MAG: hypothetical protein U0Q16_26060 [Bryobacteraceae bacterium]